MAKFFEHQSHNYGTAEKFNSDILSGAITEYVKAVEPIFERLGHGLWTGQARGHLEAIISAVLPKYSKGDKNYGTGVSLSRANVRKGFLKSTMSFTTRIPYFDRNENENTNNPSTPWNSAEIGFTAMRKYFESGAADGLIKSLLKGIFGTGRHKLRRK